MRFNIKRKKLQAHTSLPIVGDDTLVDDPVALVDDPVALVGGQAISIPVIRVTIKDVAPQAAIRTRH